MGLSRINRAMGGSLIALVTMSTLLSCSSPSKPPEDPRGMKWGEPSDEPLVVSTCRSLNDGKYQLREGLLDDQMTFEGSLYRKSVHKRLTRWSVDVDIPKETTGSIKATCQVDIYGEDLVKDLSFIEK